MTKSEIKKLTADAKQMKGSRRSRFIDENEIDTMAKLDRKRTLSGKTIRIYSNDGFVANSYKYPANIDAIERTYENNKKVFNIVQVGAKRAHGRGPSITVNNRSYIV